jgi:hypothetical protein
VGIVVLVLVAGSSCHRRLADLPTLSQDYRLTIVEDWDSQRFEITLTATGKRRICMSRTLWPNVLGQMWFGAESVWVETGERRYPIRDRNRAPCLKDCVFELSPGDSIEGFISFSEFDAGMYRDRNADRRLVFTEVPKWCKSER